METTFSLNNAYAIAKVFFSCGLIEENEILLVTDRIMDGNFNLKVNNEEKSKEASKERQEVN